MTVAYVAEDGLCEEVLGHIVAESPLVEVAGEEPLVHAEEADVYDVVVELFLNGDAVGGIDGAQHAVACGVDGDVPVVALSAVVDDGVGGDGLLAVGYGRLIIDH